MEKLIVTHLATLIMLTTRYSDRQAIGLLKGHGISLFYHGKVMGKKINLRFIRSTNPDKVVLILHVTVQYISSFDSQL